MKSSINVSFRLLTVLILSLILINCIYFIAPASEPITVKEYIQQNNYNLSTIFLLYLKSLNENGLDDLEKEFIDLLQGLPEDKQKYYAKEVYDKGFTTELLKEAKKGEVVEKPVEILEDKVIKEPENPVDIYAVIASGEYYKKESYRTTCMIMFYELLRKNGVSDANIKLLMANPHNEDFTNAISYKKYKKGFSSEYLPYKEQIEVDDNNITLKKFLKVISEIPSDNNDLVYIFYSGHGTKEGEFQFLRSFFNSKLLIKNIKKIDYGKLIIMQESCYADKLLGNLKSINNYVAIAASGKKEIANAGILSYMLVKHYETNKSIKKIIYDANKELLTIGYSQFKLFCSNGNYYNEPLILSNYLIK